MSKVIPITNYQLLLYRTYHRLSFQIVIGYFGDVLTVDIFKYKKMPCLKIMTNLSKNKIPVDFVDKIIPILSKSVKKSEEVSTFFVLWCRN